jgi:hypothetical protein
MMFVKHAQLRGPETRVRLHGYRMGPIRQEPVDHLLLPAHS